ncbi:GNAT family N-acetyltransferase [Corynebacterium sp. CNCTC7651]|uniref:GNAT family N-acetyltransferase n=1 Tax=Corynebacterium sp. CNCTC7651 TaxID=2815361 RepID=UPI001F270EB9|nr:GNAT family N-acetyltransferase [Corynebacterium sp. CNCTC7651]UIZ92588.1 GNAT family N-acetyltransferase [Corynebacterium sp. CNCTC7651]
MSHFALRRAVESDRTYLQRLNFLADVFGDETAEIGPDEREGVVPYIDGWDPDRDGGVIAFDEWRTPAGGVWLRYWEKPEDGHVNLGPDVPEIAIAVENRFAGNRLAARLLDEVAELAREQGATRIALWVDPDNARARHRYEEFGFVGIEDDPNVMVFEL